MCGLGWGGIDELGVKSLALDKLTPRVRNGIFGGEGSQYYSFR